MTWEICDFLMDGFGSCYWLASGLYTHGNRLIGLLLGYVFWNLSVIWFPLSQAICLGGSLGCVTAAALEG